MGRKSQRPTGMEPLRTQVGLSFHLVNKYRTPASGGLLGKEGVSRSKTKTDQRSAATVRPRRLEGILPSLRTPESPSGVPHAPA